MQILCLFCSLICKIFIIFVDCNTQKHGRQKLILAEIRLVVDQQRERERERERDDTGPRLTQRDEKL